MFKLLSSFVLCVDCVCSKIPIEFLYSQDKRYIYIYVYNDLKLPCYKRTYPVLIIRLYYAYSQCLLTAVLEEFSCSHKFVRLF